MPPSELVDSVRDCLKQLDRLPTGKERALLVACIARTDGTGRDAVDELEAARDALVDHDAHLGPRTARLLRAVDAILKPVADSVDLRPRGPRPPLGELREERRHRRDTDD